MNAKLVDSLAQIISTLSVDERQLLQQRVESLLAESPPTATGLLRAEPFVGMWQDRQDLEDSGTWLRDVRQQHWTDRHVMDAG